MFAPQPVGVDAWLVVPTQLADGSIVDALTGAPPEWAMPADLRSRFRSTLWLQYTMNLATEAGSAAPEWRFYKALAQAICRGAAGEIAHAAAPSALEVYLLAERSPSANSDSHAAELPSATPVYEHTCARQAADPGEAGGGMGGRSGGRHPLLPGDESSSDSVSDIPPRDDL